MTFGGTTAARVTHPSGAVLSWRISRLEDSNTNHMDYVYRNDPQEPLLEKITYGGNLNAGQAPFLEVDIVYQNRPDQNSGYHLGTLTRSTKRVQAIRTLQHDQIVRDYQFSYALSEISGQSRLRQVQECAGSGKCLAPTTFSFTPQQDSWQAATAANYIPAAIEGPKQ